MIIAPLMAPIVSLSYAIKSLVILGFAVIAAKALDWMMWRAIRRVSGSISIDMVDQIALIIRRPQF